MRIGTTNASVRTSIEMNISSDRVNGRERGPMTGILRNASTDASRYMDAAYTKMSQERLTQTASAAPISTITATVGQ